MFKKTLLLTSSLLCLLNSPLLAFEEGMPIPFPKSSSRIASDEELRRFMQEGILKLRSQGLSIQADALERSQAGLEHFQRLPLKKQEKKLESFLSTDFGALLGMAFYVFDNECKELYGIEHRANVPREIMRERYPLIDPYFQAYQKMVQPVFKALEKLGKIDAHEIAGLISIGDKGYIGYKREGDLYYPFIFEPTPGEIEYVPLFLGMHHIENPSLLLIQNNTLIQETGLYITNRKGSPGWIKVEGYYGNNPQNPYGLFPLTFNILRGHAPSPFHAYFERLIKESDSSAFMPLPLNLPEEGEAEMVSYLLLEDFLRDQGETPGRKEAFYKMLLEDALAERESASALPSSLEQTPNRESLQTAIEEIDRLETTLEARIDLTEAREGGVLPPEGVLGTLKESIMESLVRKEQEERSRAVATGKVYTSKTREKKVRRKHRAAVMESAGERDAAPTTAAETEMPVLKAREELEKAFEKYRVKTFIKYRHFISLMREMHRSLSLEGDLRASIDIRRRGSHRIIHDDLGAFTIVKPHGERETLLPARIANSLLSRYMALFQSALNKPEGSEGK